ncbi:MAG: 30S ribosomal protein S16 [Candidatus Magasanikbacteria bacterium]|nr:30S ribosomal protein S16 [Candidatus Magasanikbacteria bacterium]
MLTIRLQRVGKAKKPTYRLIVSEKARDTQGNYLELLGSFNPQVKENQLVTKTERIQYWIGQGATMSTTVNNLFVKAGIVKGKIEKSVFLSQKRAAKIAEKKSAQGGSASGGKDATPAPVASAAPVETPAPQPQASEAALAPVEAPVSEPAPAPEAVAPAPEAPAAETAPVETPAA